jgi:hypothetical protein
VDAAVAYPLLISIPVMIMIGFAVVDVIRRLDLGGGRKAMWILSVIVLPVVGTLIYLMARPFPEPGQRTGNGQALELAEVLEKRDADELTDQEFVVAKRALFERAQ